MKNKSNIEAGKVSAEVVSLAFVSLNKAGRANMEEAFRVGVNSFNSYVDRNNINVELLTVAQTYASDISQACVNAPSETAFYLTEGATGVHGGKCELYTFELDGVQRRVIRHPKTGAFMIDGLIKGLSIVTEAELLKLAHKGEFRQFAVTWYSKESAASAGVSIRQKGDVTTFAGIMLGTLDLKRSALVYHTGDGLAMVCLTTGKIGLHEKADRAVEAGALTDADKLTLKTQIFSGADMERGKSKARNAKRAERKAAVDKLAKS